METLLLWAEEWAQAGVDETVVAALKTLAQQTKADYLRYYDPSGQ